MMRPAFVLLGTALALFVVDQLTKLAVVAAIPHRSRVEVLGDFVWLWHVRNEGAAFSLLQGQLWLFVAVSIFAIGLVAWFHRSFAARSLWLHALLGVILAGTLGNLSDRLRLGYVTDFVSVGIGEVRFPTFNVADSAVVVGIIILVGYLTFFDRPAAQIGERSRTGNEATIE